MKTKLIAALWIFAMCLTACAPKPNSHIAVLASSPTPKPDAGSGTPTGASQAVLKTSVGDLMYKSARFVDEVHGQKPDPGYKLLLIFLERADKKDIDLQVFQDAHIQIFIKGDDGSNTLSTMGGWVDKDFAIGFRVPDTARHFQLIWPDNPTMEIKPSAD